MKAPRFLLRGFRRPREVASLALGKLERQVLDEIWRRGEVCVRDIYVALDVIDGLLGGGAEGIQPVLACIVDTVSERDRQLLDELDRLVKEKKRELRRKSD